MIYADRPSVTVDSLSPLGSESLWPVVSDPFNLPACSDELQAVEWREPSTGPALGAKFVARFSSDGAEWATDCIVTVHQPGHSFGWVDGDPANPSTTWRFTLSTEREGTRVSFQATVGPGPSRLLERIGQEPEREAKLVERWLDALRRSMTVTLSGLIELAQPTTIDLRPAEARPI